jgi:hypothetical protein
MKLFPTCLVGALRATLILIGLLNEGYTLFVWWFENLIKYCAKRQKQRKFA